MVIALRQAGLNTYIVEDNRTIRENLVGTLEELATVNVLGFAEGEDEARRWLADHPTHWNLVIVDLFLKQGSGLGVLQACLVRDPHQKAIVLSNYATPDIRKRCLQLGADAVFDKSNEIEDLVTYCLSQVPRQDGGSASHALPTGEPPSAA